MSSPITWNYKALLEKGVELIEQFSSDHWTDYNVHDPGIATMEFLCYALTDLASRTGLPLTGLLAERAGDRVVLGGNFPPAHKILPPGPVTLLDYRRLLMDIPGVRNAWIKSVTGAHAPVYALPGEGKLGFEGEPEERMEFKGFYSVDVEFSKTLPRGETEGLLLKVRNTLMGNRNLCEDFARIREVPIEEIGICADLELSPETNVDRLAAELIYAMDMFISPDLRRYTLKEMLDIGKTVEEIFDAPLPRHGFILDNDLKKSNPPDELHGSDFVRRLMDIPGIIAVKRLLFTTHIDNTVQNRDMSAVVTLTKDHALRFSMEKSRLRFLKEGVPYVYDPPAMENHLSRLRAKNYQAPIAPGDLTPKPPRPMTVDVAGYTSIQHHYPRNFGIGPEGLPGIVPPGRKAAAKQFKAFLLLFEQFMADYTAQLKFAPRLLSPAPLEKSFAHSLPTDVPDFDTLISDAKAIAGYYEDKERFHDRRNRFLDHLLSRFAEQYREYTMLLETIYGPSSMELLMKDKERLLTHFPELSRARFLAWDYTGTSRERKMSGLEQNLRILLGYSSETYLSAAEETRFTIFEPDDGTEHPGKRFRILNENGEILLTGTGKYFSRDKMRRDMKQMVMLGLSKTNYRVLQEDSGQWRFSLHNTEGAMIAENRAGFDTGENAGKAMEACVPYLKSILSEERLFILEHILLRPYASDRIDEAVHYSRENDERYLLATCFDDNDTDCGNGDAYSFRTTVVMPAWPERFREMSFRNYLDRFIRQQTPAHIYTRICWVSKAHMDAFEDAFSTWKALLPLKNRPGRMEDYLSALEQLVKLWRTLRNVYPRAHLYDCHENQDITPTVLGRSALGETDGVNHDQE
ncbi:MAG: hypothetical protein GY737_19270 [Desulfobacteraceae bacterium]|nr:hypothetical protein [Desulfobacteraceae bacterium]